VKLAAQLLVFVSPGGGAAPPWPSGAADVAMTAVEVEVAPGQWRALAGGMVARLLHPPASHVEQLFGRLLEEVKEEAKEEEEEGGASSVSGGVLSALGTGSRNGSEQQQQPYVEVCCWGIGWGYNGSGERQGSRTAGAAHNTDSSARVPGEPVAATMAHIVGQLQAAQQLCLDGEAHKAMRLLQQALEVSDALLWGGSTAAGQRVRLGAFHTLRMQLLAALLKAAIDSQGAWQAALSAARQLIPMYEHALRYVDGVFCVAPYARPRWIAY
jgi:hypothetical protein